MYKRVNTLLLSAYCVCVGGGAGYPRWSIQGGTPAGPSRGGSTSVFTSGGGSSSVFTSRGVGTPAGPFRGAQYVVCNI